jgi:hypothetical protein
MNRRKSRTFGLMATLCSAALIGLLPAPASAATETSTRLVEAPAPAPDNPPRTRQGATLDARAAAGAGTGEDRPGIQASWPSGNLAPGATQGWVWYNVGPVSVHRVGFRPSGANTFTAICGFEATRTWYVQRPNGTREFHFVIQNVGNVACGTEILLAIVGGIISGPAGTMVPGEYRAFHWNNSSPDLAYLAGASPIGATSSASCQIEVVRTWYKEQSSGELEFHYLLHNPGTLTCSADVRLAWLPKDPTIWEVRLGELEIGWSTTWAILVAQNNIVHVPALNRLGFGCELAVVRSWYEQEISNGGTSLRWFVFKVRNIGWTGCSEFAVTQFAPVQA